jgi:hypothetical protein
LQKLNQHQEFDKICKKKKDAMTKNRTPELYTYTITQVENGFFLLDDLSNPIKTHLGSDYPPLPFGILKILAEDINEIIVNKAYGSQGKKRKAKLQDEVLVNPGRSKIRKDQESMSFSLCVENTLIEMGVEKDIELPLQYLIQWDMLYRMSPDPHAKMDQMSACEQAISYLGKDWKDLPANYCQDLQQMNEEKVPFVAEGLIGRLTHLMEDMVPAEKVAVWFLYEFFQRYSITIPLLWVKGLVDSENMEDSFYTLASDFSENEIKKMKKEEGDFVQRRLKYLREYLMVKIGAAQ